MGYKPVKKMTKEEKTGYANHKMLMGLGISILGLLAIYLNSLELALVILGLLYFIKGFVLRFFK